MNKIHEGLGKLFLGAFKQEKRYFFFSFFSFSLLFLLFLPFSKTAKDDDFIANKCLKFLESTKATKRQTVVKAQKEQQGLSKKKVSTDKQGT